MSDTPMRLHVTFHARNRARTRLMKEIRAADVGAGIIAGDVSLSRWLRERAIKAVADGRRITAGRSSTRYLHDGVIFVFNPSMHALLTVYPLARDEDEPLEPGKHRGARRRRQRRAKRILKQSRDRFAPPRKQEPEISDWEDAA
jgi:hypothetical protein